MATLQSKLILTLQDQVTGRMRAISAQVAAFRGRMRAATMPVMGMTTRLAALGGGYLGVTAGLRGTAGAAIGFEEAFADVRKVLDASDEQFANVRQQILNMSKVLPTGAEGIAAIYAAAAQSNVPMNELGKFSEMVAKVAVAWDTTEGETSQALAEIKTQLNMNVDQIGLYADAINHLSNTTAARAPNLIEFSRRVAAQGEMFGFSAQESLAFGSAMIAMGAQAEIAATSFRNMGKALTRGAGTKKEAMRGWKRIGMDPKVVAKEMQKDAAKTTMKVIEAVQKVAKHERADIAFALFGEEARALMPVINDAKELRRQMDMVGTETNYAGSAFKEYMERANTTANVLSIMKNRIRAIGIEIGDSMLPGIKEFATALSDVFDSMGDRVTPWKRMEWGLKGFMQGLGYDGGIKEMVNDISDLLFGKIDPSKGADQLGLLFRKMEGWGKAVRELSDAIRDNPIAQFIGEMAGHGFKLFVAAAGFTLLAGALTKLAKAAWMLSGAGVAVGIIKMLAGLGGALLKTPKLPKPPAPPKPAVPPKLAVAQPKLPSTPGLNAKPGAGFKSPWTPGAESTGGRVRMPVRGPTGTPLPRAPVPAPLMEFPSSALKPTGWGAALKDFFGKGGLVATGLLAAGEYGIASLVEQLNQKLYTPEQRAKADELLGTSRRKTWLGNEVTDTPTMFENLRRLDNWLSEQFPSMQANVPGRERILPATAPIPSARPEGTFDKFLEGMRNLAPQQDPTPTLREILGAVHNPSGTQNVHVQNPPQIHAPVNVTVYATTMADAGQIAQQVGAKVQDTLAGYYSDGAYA